MELVDRPEVTEAVEAEPIIQKLKIQPLGWIFNFTIFFNK